MAANKTKPRPRKRIDAKEKHKMSRSNQEVIRLVCEEVWGKGKTDLVNDLYAENYTPLNPTPGIPANREGVKMEIAAYYQAFPDMQVTVEDLVSEGDKVVARYTIRGTNSGELMGTPATGKTAEITGISIVRLENGKVTEEFALADMMGLFQQLGLAPELA
jgi:steroid delta-isomerase-like uncharacterized protein